MRKRLPDTYNASVLDALFHAFRHRIPAATLICPKNRGTWPTSPTPRHDSMVPSTRAFLPGECGHSRETSSRSTRTRWRRSKPQLSSSMVRGLRAVFEIAEGIKNLHRPDVATCIRPNRNQHGPRRPPGVRAEKRGTRVKRGQALQVMCNPRPVAKAVIIQASGKAKLSLSSFMIRRP